MGSLPPDGSPEMESRSQTKTDLFFYLEQLQDYLANADIEMY